MPRAPRSHRPTKRLPTLCIRRDTAGVPSLQTPYATTHWARSTDQPCRRKSSNLLGKNCVVSSQIVVEFRSAEIGVNPEIFTASLSQVMDYYRHRATPIHTLYRSSGFMPLLVRVRDVSPLRFASDLRNDATPAGCALAPPRQALCGHAPSRGLKSAANPDVL
jgi:hypothetical protein